VYIKPQSIRTINLPFKWYVGCYHNGDMQMCYEKEEKKTHCVTSKEQAQYFKQKQ